MPYDSSFEPYGLIGQKWRETNGEVGPFGSPTAPEKEVPGRRGRIQDYKYGQIAWSPDQGSNMVVWACPNESAGPRAAVFRWGPTDPFSYDFFIVRWRQTSDADSSQQELPGGTGGSFEIKGRPDAVPLELEFIVQGCDGSFLGGSDCIQGWTVPVLARFY